MEFKIKSKVLGRTVTFFCEGEKLAYVFVDLEGGKEGSLGRQICKGGGFGGSTLKAGEDFEATCRKWYRAYIRDHVRGD